MTSRPVNCPMPDAGAFLVRPRWCRIALPVALAILWWISGSAPVAAQKEQENRQAKRTTILVENRDQALDQIARELVYVPQRKPKLALWLIDASNSMSEFNQRFAARLEDIFAHANRDVPDRLALLKTGAALFGKTTLLLTDRPVTDVRSLAAMIQKAPDEDSGLENVFASVQRILKVHQPLLESHEVILTILTDENGDDVGLMEETIRLCQKQGVRVFVLGVTCPFGSGLRYYPHTLADGRQAWLALDSGPETAGLEFPFVPLWGDSEYHQLPMSSGFGSYALSRLCEQTGGHFIAVETGHQITFRPDILANYEPDRLAAPEYQAAIRTNKAKLAVIKVAQLFRGARRDLNGQWQPGEQRGLPSTLFNGVNGVVPPAHWKMAHKSAVAWAGRVRELQSILRSGKSDRPKLSQPRWEATYDLALGQALAHQIRAEEYQRILLVRLKIPAPFLKPDSNHWQLVPTELPPGSNSASIAIAEEAKALLTRVVTSHPDTPWALVAQRELKLGCSWLWDEIAK